MTLIESLKALAEKYPEKWGWVDEDGYQQFMPAGRMHVLVEFDEDGATYSTEDCDAILAEHGLVMWVWPETDEWLDIGHEHWVGWFRTKSGSNIHGEPPSYPTKREATESSFLAALKYLLKEGK
jgi:hypothetical protein